MCYNDKNTCVLCTNTVSTACCRQPLPPSDPCNCYLYYCASLACLPHCHVTTRVWQLPNVSECWCKNRDCECEICTHSRLKTVKTNMTSSTHHTSSSMLPNEPCHSPYQVAQRCIAPRSVPVTVTKPPGYILHTVTPLPQRPKPYTTRDLHVPIEPHELQPTGCLS
jgi:hypothetical protein